MADVKIPGIGPVPKGFVYGGAGLAVILIGYAYYRHNQQSAAAASTTATDTTGTADPSIDPATGIPYAQEYSADSGYGTYGGGSYPGALAYYDPTTGQYIGTGVGVSTVTQVTTNAAWFQQAEQYLIGIGYQATDVSAALGKYIAGTAVTSDQQSIIQAAIGAEGNPPQAGATGFPPSIMTGAPPGQTPPPTGGGTKPGAAPGGLKVSKTSDGAYVSWNAVPGAGEYHVRGWGYTPGLTMVHDRTVNGTNDSFAGLKRNTLYGWHVQAVNTAGAGPWSGSNYFRTNK